MEDNNMRLRDFFKDKKFVKYFVLFWVISGLLFFGFYEAFTSVFHYSSEKAQDDAIGMVCLMWYLVMVKKAFF